MKSKFISYAATIFLLFGLVAFPKECADAVRSALSLCLQVALPSLFPFFVLSALMIKSGVSETLGRMSSSLMARVFRLSGAGASALVLGMIGGYPVGADCVRALCASGKLEKREAEHLLIFCNNSGPAFILGAVGCGILGSMRLGLALLAVHWLSAGLIGFLLRFRTKPTSEAFQNAESLGFSAAFCDAVKSAMGTMLNVSSFILFFAVLTELLHKCSLLPRAGVLGAVCTGIFELTSGIATLQTATGDPRVAFVSAAALLGFGGVSVHAQTAALLSETNLSLAPFFWGKLAHAGVSFALAWTIAPKALPASAVLTQSQTNWAGLAVTFVSVFSFFILFLFSEKRTGNE